MVKIVNEAGIAVDAAAPSILSASRATDIPAFYPNWLMERLDAGFISKINPFNGKPVHISLRDLRFIVFWTKNPLPIINHLKTLDKKGIGYYFQFTLNDYEKEKLEPGLPAVSERIETFKTLSELIGKEKVIWRFDPLILTATSDIESLLRRIEVIGTQICNATNKLVFSFADILKYRKVRHNMCRLAPALFIPETLAASEFTKVQMRDFAKGLAPLVNQFSRINPDFHVASCCEEIDLDVYNIKANRCIDDELIHSICGNDGLSVDFLYPKGEAEIFSKAYTHNPALKSKGQRAHCGCIESRDAGSYNSCPHGCLYCYANITPEKAKENFRITTSDNSQTAKKHNTPL